MKTKIPALLLSALLCLSLITPAFAAWEEWFDDEGNSQGWHDASETKPDPKPEEPDPGPSTPSDRDDDDDDDGYRISTPTRTPGGKVQVRPSSASQGSKVTITVIPDDGYELDTLTVKDSRGNSIKLTDEGGGKYTFIMPASKVTVEVTFKRTASSGSHFTDVPASHTFYGDISWVAAQGYMGGYNDGTFRPSANTTRQALWMVLARIDGANPTDMSAARDWATRNGVSDGSNPGGAMTRQQMVTMLYRYAMSKGYKTTGGVSLDSFTDASGVADYAQDAMSWAVGNGIVQGTGGGALNPNGTATRAHFAAFLHRFCTSMGIA